MSVDSKLACLDAELNQYIQRFPRFIDSSILRDRDRILAYFDADFVQKRPLSHLLRLLLSQHLQRKKLLGSDPLVSKSRAVEFRILPVKLQYPFGSKQVLGILVQISLANRYELFDEEILQRSIHRLIPNLHLVKDSLYKFQGHDTIKIWYAEFEKPENDPFTLSELTLLKKELGKEFLERTEKLVPSVFKIRNQEEVLRNILTLSQEIDRLSDLPQIMISFETQSSEEVTFTVIIVRAENLLSTSLENLITQGSSFCRWILEKKQIVRYLQDHEPIVAYLFRVVLFLDSTILRSDASLNFFAARQKIAAFLKENMGDYRDFNGGILIKQEEMLLSLRSGFPHLSLEHIENIFYSITPIEMQAILPRQTLQAIIDLTTQTSLIPLHKAHDYHFVSRSHPPFNIILLRIPSGPFYEKAKDHFQYVDFPENIQASFSFNTQDSYLFGYLISLEDQLFHDRFIKALKNLLSYWSDEVKRLKILCLSLNNSITSLDPRIGGDAVSSILLKMLFEGLTRIGPDGKLELAIAEKVEISEDHQTYLFHLRPSYWSNGDPLTSRDFEYAWKKILSPNFNSPYTYPFSCIKNAEKVKKGLAPMSELGIYSVSDHLLKVELSTASSYFLETLSLPIFSPIHSLHDVNFPNWPLEERSRYVCNGAFKIEKNSKNSGYTFIKNPLYWEKDNIKLDRIIITHSHHSQSLEMFLRNQIHWIGTPMGTWDTYFKPGPRDVIINYPDNGLYWAICQTEHPLLKNKKIRKALVYALDRKAILHATDYLKDPAFSPLPSIHSQITEESYSFSPEKAQYFWEEGLKELGLTKDTLPSIEIAFTRFTAFGKPTAEFLCQAWQKILQINCQVRGFDFKSLLNKLISKDFDIGLIRWQPWVNDPFYTLNCFTSLENPFNFCRLTHPQLIELIKTAQIEKDPHLRKDLIKQIEEILIDEIPIIPLFKTYYQSMRKKNLKIHPNHTLLDFKWASLEAD